MHIPENYLSPATCAVMGAAMVPVLVRTIKKVQNDIPKEKMPLIGIGAAFSFIAMMFNVPLPGGTTGHAVGGTLLAILIGPEAACLAVTIALVLQAFLFGDGGILALGANCFNLAFVLPFVGYYTYKFIVDRIKLKNKELVGAAVGSYVGLNIAALLTAIQFGIQPYIASDAAGQPLYCPYGLGIAIPAMMGGHLTLFGFVEAIFTVSVFSFLRKTSPDIVRNSDDNINYKPILILLVALVALVPLGLIAEGTAWGEWGREELSTMVGFTPEGMASGFEWSSLIPDYEIGGMNAVLGYYLSAILGVAILVGLFKVLATFKKSKVNFD